MSEAELVVTVGMVCSVGLIAVAVLILWASAGGTSSGERAKQSEAPVTATRWSGEALKRPETRRRPEPKPMPEKWKAGILGGKGGGSAWLTEYSLPDETKGEFDLRMRLKYGGARVARIDRSEE